MLESVFMVTTVLILFPLNISFLFLYWRWAMYIKKIVDEENGLTAEKEFLLFAFVS